MSIPLFPQQIENLINQSKVLTNFGKNLFNQMKVSK